MSVNKRHLNAAANRRYRATKYGKIAAAQYAASHRERNPLKAKARAILNHAIRDGNVTSQPCIICLNPRTEAHHYDYSKPLQVIWVCQVHHSLFHAQG